METLNAKPNVAQNLLYMLLFLLFLYFFLLSIQTMEVAFKCFGRGFAEGLIQTTSSPMVGLFIGLLSTSLMQSSSLTTSIAVGLVAGGALTLHNAVPIIMGANIGTTITNTLVSLGHIRQREEFKRAYSCSLVHDLFNIMTVIILFPLQYYFGYLEWAAAHITSIFASSGGMVFTSPLKVILEPVAAAAADLMGQRGILILIVSLVCLFMAMQQMVKYMKILIMSRAEVIFEKMLFRTPYHSLLFGMILTALVQSSSVTTSLMVPLAGAGMLSLHRVFPYTLGANIGTTITAIMASLATSNPLSISVAFAHLVFNISGILIFWWMPFVPVRMAEWLGEITSRRRYYAFVYLGIVFFLIPGLMIWLFR